MSAEKNYVGPVVFTNRYGIRITAGGYDYNIKWSAMKNQDDLARWIHHLSGKRWWKSAHNRELIQVVFSHLGLGNVSILPNEESF